MPRKHHENPRDPGQSATTERPNPAGKAILLWISANAARGTPDRIAILLEQTRDPAAPFLEARAGPFLPREWQGGLHHSAHPAHPRGRRVGIRGVHGRRAGLGHEADVGRAVLVAIVVGVARLETGRAELVRLERAPVLRGIPA